MSSLFPEQMITSVLSRGESSRSAPNASMSEPHQLVILLLLALGDQNNLHGVRKGEPFLGQDRLHVGTVSRATSLL